MRLGEIVRTPDGDFLRYVAECEYLDHGDGPFWELSSGTYWRCGIPGLEIVTVAELFEAAGHPVPDGKLRVNRCAIWQALSVEAFYAFADRWIEHDARCWNREMDGLIIDLSRLPALDAWDDLPECVKAAVK